MNRDLIPRSFLLLATVSSVMVVLLIVCVVIPPVLTDTSPRFSPVSATATFLMLSGVHVFAGLVILTATARPGARTRMTALSAVRDQGVLLYVPAGLLLGMGLWMLDGAFAPTAHRPALHSAAVAVFVCVFADLAAGMLTLLASLLVRQERGSGPLHGA